MAVFPMGIVFLCAACAGGSPPAEPIGASRLSPLLDASWRPPAGAQCGVWDERPAPAPGTVLDLAALRASFGDLLPAGHHATLEVGYDSSGLAEAIRVVEVDAGPDGQEVAERLARDLRPALRVLGPSDEPPVEPGFATLLLRLDGGAPIDVRTGRSESCPPRRDRLSSERTLNSVLHSALDVGVRVPGGRHVVEVWTFVTGQGRPDTVQIRESSGSEVLDELVARAVGRFRYQPAYLNRQTVDVWVQQDLIVNVPRRSGGEGGR